MSPHFRGKNGVKNGMVYHFWNFRVYSRDGHIPNYIEARYIAVRYIITWLDQCKVDSQYLTCKNVENTSYPEKYTIILYYYSIFENVCSERMFYLSPVGLHFRTNVRLPERAYLLFPYLDPHFEFDTEFGKTLKNQHFHHFLYR